MVNRNALARIAAALVIASIAAGCGADDSRDEGGLDASTDTDSDADTDTDADSDTDADAGAGALEIIGDYHDDWGGEHHVTAEAWTAVYPGYGDAGPETSVSHVTAWDNDEDFLVAQNDAELSYDPGLWSRYDWTYSDLGDGGVDLYYCQIAYDAADEATAAANETAEPGDLIGGCGGYSWTRLIED